MTIASRAFLLTLICSSFAFAQAKEVTLEQIMAHPDWLGRQAENPHWADDGASIYFERTLIGRMTARRSTSSAKSKAPKSAASIRFPSMGAGFAS